MDRPPIDIGVKLTARRLKESMDLTMNAMLEESRRRMEPEIQRLIMEVRKEHIGGKLLKRTEKMLLARIQAVIEQTVKESEFDMRVKRMRLNRAKREADE